MLLLGLIFVLSQTSIANTSPLFDARSLEKLLPAYWVQERTKWFVYHERLSRIQVQTGFVKLVNRADIAFDGNLRMLTGLKIGVGTEYLVSNEFDQAEYLNKINISTMNQMIKMLWYFLFL